MCNSPPPRKKIRFLRESLLHNEELQGTQASCKTCCQSRTKVSVFSLWYFGIDPKGRSQYFTVQYLDIDPRGRSQYSTWGRRLHLRLMPHLSAEVPHQWMTVQVIRQVTVRQGEHGVRHAVVGRDHHG